MNASIEIQNGVKTLSGAPADAKYYNNAGTPYTNVAEVNSQIPSALRGRGLTVNVAGVEYWYKDGILDSNLVVKVTGGGETHTHDNKTTLDKIGESAGNPTWNGSAWPGSGGAAPTADNVNTALQGFTEGTPQDSDFLVFIGKIKITLANFKTLLATAFNNTFAAKTHAHAQSDITGLSTALAGKQDVLGFTPEQAGVAATLISNLKNGVSSEGDTLKKLYDLIVASYSEITVPNTTNRNAYNVTKLPTNIFVTNDGDGKWALYKCISLGSNRGNDIKISDPDLLNAVMTASQIKTAYESNADTNAFTNALLAKLNAFTATFTSELKTAYDAAVTASHSHSNKAILDAVEVAYTTAMNNKLSGIENNANNYVHPNTHPTTILEGVDAVNGATDYYLNKKGEFKQVAAGSSETGQTIRTKLEALTGNDKLNYSALQGVVSSYTLDFRDDVTQIQDINIEGPIRIDAIQVVNVSTLQLGAITLTLPLAAPVNIAQGAYNVWTITRNTASAASVGIKYTKL